MGPTKTTRRETGGFKSMGDTASTILDGYCIHACGRVTILHSFLVEKLKFIFDNVGQPNSGYEDIILYRIDQTLDDIIIIFI